MLIYQDWFLGHYEFIDLDSDNDLDFVANKNGSYEVIGWMENTPSGFLAWNDLLENSTTIYSFFFHDLNQDGYQDLFVFNAGFNILGRFYRGIGPNEFDLPTILYNGSGGNGFLHDYDFLTVQNKG